jgi:hypothetical protein
VGELCPGCPKKQRTPKAKAKPKQKSWEQAKSADGLDLPEGDFDYDDFILREFGSAPHQKTGVKWYWWVLALLILAGMFAGLILI